MSLFCYIFNSHRSNCEISTYLEQFYINCSSITVGSIFFRFFVLLSHKKRMKQKIVLPSNYPGLLRMIIFGTF